MKLKYSNVALLIVVLPLSGCSTPQPDPAKENLIQFVHYYNMYAGEHQGKAPPSEDAFKQFLAAKKVTDSDKLFTSPRDNQPYKITYGVTTAPDPSKSSLPPDQAANQVIVAEEQTGAGGKRLVAYNSGVIKEVP